jgi:hypothetical protein
MTIYLVIREVMVGIVGESLELGFCSFTLNIPDPPKRLDKKDLIVF